MKWLDRLRGKGEPAECDHYFCQCGGMMTRQTTLLEFYPDLLHQKGQRLITDYTTESVGMQSEPRRYRGNI